MVGDRLLVGFGVATLLTTAAASSAVRAARHRRLATTTVRCCATATHVACPPYVHSTQKRCLLISNSKLAGLGYLDHVLEHISAFVEPTASSEKGAKSVVFVPYAQRDRDGYATRLRSALQPIGIEVKSLHEADSAEARLEMVNSASYLFVGGGNTYRLLKCLQQDGGALLPLIARRVADGTLGYIGSSAGTNLAAPTIRNTNDMPIVWPETLNGLSLVPFQINTHYIDEARELQNHMGETRAKRLEEFVEENDVPVLALREGATVRVDGERAILLGPAKRSPQVTWDGARLVRRLCDGGARDVAVGDELDALMAAADGSGVAALFDVAPLMSDAGQEARKVGAGVADQLKSG